MKKTILTLVLCSFIGAAFAQAKLGVTAGLNASSASISEDFLEGMDVGFKAGFQVGLVLDYALSENLSLIPELNFSQKGFTLSGDVDDVDYKYTGTLNYLTLPINLAYKFDLGMDQKFLLFAGPYLGYGLSSSEKIKAAGVSVDLDEEDALLTFGSEDGELKKLDYGLNIGAGYQYNKLVFKLQYNMGLNNLIQGGSEYDISAKTTNVAVTVGYLF